MRTCGCVAPESSRQGESKQRFCSARSHDWLCHQRRIGIGGSLAAAPLPHHRAHGTHTAVRPVERSRGRQPRKPKRVEDGMREGDLHRLRVGRPPHIPSVVGCRCGISFAQTMTLESTPPALIRLPLFPDDATQPPPDPRVQISQHRRGFAEGEVREPPA